MKKVSYNKLMELNPTELDKVVNQLGQTIVFYEHPLRGDEAPVLAVYHEEKKAVHTDFFETDDFYANSDYNPIYFEGSMQTAFEVI